MLSSVLGSALRVGRPAWAMQWHRSQVDNELQQVTNDYNMHKLRSSRTRTTRIRTSKKDIKPCDSLRRYVQRAEAAAASSSTARRTRWAAPRSTRWSARSSPPQSGTACKQRSHLQLYALARFGVDVESAQVLYAHVLSRVRQRAAALGSVQPVRVSLRASEALTPSASEDASWFAALYARVCAHGVCDLGCDLGYSGRIEARQAAHTLLGWWRIRCSAGVKIEPPWRSTPRGGRG